MSTTSNLSGIDGRKNYSSKSSSTAFRGSTHPQAKCWNTDQAYTLIAFTVFSEIKGCAHYKAYCKKEKGDTGGSYLFDDDKVIEKRKNVDFATMTSKGNIGNKLHHYTISKMRKPR